ncbi:MAG: PD-(D/E)XK nuclease family protein [Actinobacteria bacterium]|nr:MAG: PD-(D/E)XK nuclease family protein [Actinomycetota bacterium]
MGVGMPPSLSPSAISAFKECPLAFKFSYVQRLPEPPSPWTSKGTLVRSPTTTRSFDARLL